MTRTLFRSSFLRALTVAVLSAACGCTTTGDPTQGGLFGWSETKAKARIAEKERQLASERGTLAKQKREGETLSHQQTENRGRIAHERVEADERAETERQRAELAAIDENAATLEREAPTPSVASRARRLRAEISRIQRDETLSINERWQKLRSLDAEITRSRAELGIQPR